MVEVQNRDEARSTVETEPAALVVAPAETILAETAALPEGASVILRQIGEAVGVVDREGELTWADPRLLALSERVRARFVERCVQAAGLLGRAADRDTAGARSRRYSIDDDDRRYELVVSTAASDESGSVSSVVGVLWDVTTSRRLQARVDAIDAAGSQLMKIESTAIAELNMAERLKLLESRIVQYVQDLLNFDNFEIRLLDRESNQLELVIAVGISPLKIGEVIFAEAERNGISGHVAATGRSYICPDVQADPLYREGLDNAASSLTVPLKLHDQVIGVFNIESNTPSAFDEHDRQFAEIVGRYVAMAMNILDLLVVERYTTNEEVTENVLGELSEPLGEITTEAVELRGREHLDPETNAALERIVDAAAAIRRRIEQCAAGPRGILGAEQELHREEVDPAMLGRRVLVADNEPAIRTTLDKILSQRGCDVTVAEDGLETIAALEASSKTKRPFDLVLSDIKMPDHSGYEVFSKAKSICPDTPVILMTGFGYDPHHSIVRASQEGLHSFLFKPFKATQLIEAVTKAFTGGEAGKEAVKS
ncbi:MAG: GAF domain-containing protein [Planctomycetota bacterium]